jgi:hypothetical protein
VKVCESCHNELELAAFPVDRRFKAGRGSVCRACRAELDLEVAVERLPPPSEEVLAAAAEETAQFWEARGSDLAPRARERANGWARWGKQFGDWYDAADQAFWDAHYEGRKADADRHFDRLQHPFRSFEEEHT